MLGPLKPIVDYFTEILDLIRGTPKRRHFRLRYSKFDNRPKINIENYDYEIVDISISGCKLVGGARFSPPTATVFAVTITFANGHRHKTLAKTIRKMGYFVCLNFSAYVPEKLLASELRRIRNSIPNQSQS